MIYKAACPSISLPYSFSSFFWRKMLEMKFLRTPVFAGTTFSSTIKQEVQLWVKPHGFCIQTINLKNLSTILEKVLIFPTLSKKILL